MSKKRIFPPLTAAEERLKRELIEERSALLRKALVVDRDVRPLVGPVQTQFVGPSPRQPIIQEERKKRRKRRKGSRYSQAGKNRPLEGLFTPQFRSHLMAAYNLEIEDYVKLLKLQQHACAICRRPFERTPHVDHCHKEGYVRGLLCSDCNQGLGLFADNREWLYNAFVYLGETTYG